jgi:trans-aconitate methyltransferase
VQPLLYRDLVSWYRLVDPPADHADEAEVFTAAFERAASARPETLLELGSGAGHNALHLKQRFACTLTDLSEPMLSLSRELNPACEHIAGDMRTLRLDRVFDAVLIHDAIVYMTSEADLLAALRTAFVHTRPGGVAIFAPDCVRETFREQTELLSESDATRAMRGVMWTWDPNPRDDTYTVDFAFLLRDGERIDAVHDHHLEGVFPRATWQRLLEGVGYQVEPLQRPLGAGEFDEVFLCRRPTIEE